VTLIERLLAILSSDRLVMRIIVEELRRCRRIRQRRHGDPGEEASSASKT
jgi:hypothetical protein